MHTPGPWRVATFGGQLEVVKDSAKSICSVCEIDGEANARLIAAAPELLAAANRALEDYQLTTTRKNSLAAEALRRAIRKATD